MSNPTRANPFADTAATLPSFPTKPKASQPVAADQVERIAQEHNFPSRQPVKAKQRPPRRIADQPHAHPRSLGTEMLAHAQRHP